MQTTDNEYMRRCFALAEQGRFTARPNPVVGCVLVAGDRIVGEGWHALAGKPHAEINALQHAGERARGATAYVSLEPCAHHGRTGPCADALVAAGVTRVVYAMEDPNPLVSGQGLARLRAAGIAVDGPVLPQEAEDLNPGFCKRMRTGLPWVRCKVGMSLDARTAMASGESQWITGPEAREDVQRWRARSCAVLTGIGTVLVDDPALNVRLPDFAGTQPWRVVVDSTRRTPDDARILQSPGNVLLAHARIDSPMDTGPMQSTQVGPETSLHLMSVRNDEGRVHLEGLLGVLADTHHCNEVLVEAGPTLGAALMREGLVDELLLYVAPLLLGSEARPLFDLRGLLRLSEAIRLEFRDVAMVGKDCRMRTLVSKAE